MSASQRDSFDGRPAKKKPKPNSEEITIEAKKQRACHSCRRVKLRCVLTNEGEACQRCTARGEECIFKTPLHDLKWQEETSAKIEGIASSVDYIIQFMQTISRQLNIPFNPPATRAPDASSPGEHSNEYVNSPNSSLQQFPSTENDQYSQQVQTHSNPLKRNHPAHDYSTQLGAEELLALAYTNFSPPFPIPDLPSNASLSTPGRSLSTSLSAETSAKQGKDGNFFGLLDDLMAIPSPERDTGGRTSTMAQKLMGTADQYAIGSSDPRVDVVKSGLVSKAVAEILVDFFHAHLSHHLFGFPLRLGSWPYLPAGKATITPLILGSICLVSSERIPQYHELCDHLMSSDLKESILNATPGLSFAPGTEANQINGLEPDLDLELGIGPEEICALLVYATFSCSPRSDVIATTAFEWTRGYLKTFMLPSPPPVTYGEVFGLLPARRNLTFENWLRLWLFGYVVDVQQSLHHERRAQTFDPSYFCDTLLLSSVSSAEEQTDRELVAHARLCTILHKIQLARTNAGWTYSSLDDMVVAYERWNADLDRWWAEQEIPGEPPASGSQSAQISLNLFKLFARNYVNLAASKEPQLSQDPVHWRFLSRSSRAAYEMVKVVQDEPYSSGLNILLPFYVKMVSLASIVLLNCFQHQLYMTPPCPFETAVSLISDLASNMSRAPVHSKHATLIAASALKKAIDRTERQHSRQKQQQQQQQQQQQNQPSQFFPHHRRNSVGESSELRSLRDHVGNNGKVRED